MGQVCMPLPAFDLSLDKKVESKVVPCLWLNCWFREFLDRLVGLRKCLRIRVAISSLQYITLFSVTMLYVARLANRAKNCHRVPRT